jgi:heat shock protein HtpX
MVLWIIGGLFVFIFCWYMTGVMRFAAKTNSGVKSMESGDVDTAERLFRKALKIAEGLPKAVGGLRITAWLNLSRLAAKRNDRELAVRHAGSAIRAMDGLKDSDHQFHLVFDHIAELLEENGEFSDAVQYRKYAVSSLPAQGPQTALALLNLARALKDAGRPQEAAPLFEGASRACTPQNAKEAANAGCAIQDMALALRRCGQNDQAERRFREALRLFTESQGADSMNVAIAWSNLGVLYAETGRYEESLNTYDQSLRIRRKLTGDRSPSVALVENNRANCLRQMGRLDEAEQAAKNSIAVLRETNSPTLPNALDTLGTIYLDCEHDEEALAALSESCALLRTQPKHDPETLLRYSERHAQALENLGRDEEAQNVRAAAAKETSQTRRTLALLLHQQSQEPPRQPGPDRTQEIKPHPIEAPSESSIPLATQALLAVLLTLGFYTLALGCIALLTLFAWRTHSPYFIVLDILTSLGILRAILPARSHAEKLGSQLGRDRHPALFETIESIARAAGEPMPSAVYLTPEPGAAVSEEGGFLAIGSTRVLYIGYPTLLLLTVAEFRSVLAHEFGHYSARDTKFSRWIYPARRAVVRSFFLVRGGWKLLFEGYGKMFLRITQGLSRQQEFNADRLAATLTSPDVTASALKAIGSSLFSSYVSNELKAVFAFGLLPPIAAGFEVYRREHAHEETIEEATSTPYDSHPSLAARLKALELLPHTSNKDLDPSPAILLLNRREQLEQWFAKIVEPSPRMDWRSVEWSACSSIVFVPFFETEIAKFKDLFEYVRFSEIPLILPDQAAAAVQRVYPGMPNARAYAEFIVGRAGGLALLREGWTGEGAPGDPFWFTSDLHRLNPSQLVADLWSGKLTDADWRAIADEAQISDLALAATE